MLLGWDYPYDPPHPYPEEAIYGEDELVVYLAPVGRPVFSDSENRIS